MATKAEYKKMEELLKDFKAKIKEIETLAVEAKIGVTLPVPGERLVVEGSQEYMDDYGKSEYLQDEFGAYLRDADGRYKKAKDADGNEIVTYRPIDEVMSDSVGRKVGKKAQWWAQSSC